MKGPSAAGKSAVVERVLAFFPDEAHYSLSGMSERALAYSEEPLQHRVFVVYEAVGLAGDWASYLMRSLLSEGRIRYEVAEATSEGVKSRLIEREGPTGLIVTTTAVSLHAENETRLISIPSDDSAAQTAAVMRAIAGRNGRARDLTEWHKLQFWLADGERRVEVPFAEVLAELIPPVAVRLRRDFGSVLGLVRAHALLHRASRGTDEDGAVLADIEDYTGVRELVVDLISDGIGQTVGEARRETVRAVEGLTGEGRPQTTHTAIAKELGIDRTAANRRVLVAIDKGYLRNDEDRRGKPAKIALADPLPNDVEILPTADLLREGCAGVQAHPGGDTPPPPVDDRTLADLSDAELAAAAGAGATLEAGARSTSLASTRSRPWSRSAGGAAASRSKTLTSTSRRCSTRSLTATSRRRAPPKSWESPASDWPPCAAVESSSPSVPRPDSSTCGATSSD